MSNLLPESFTVHRLEDPHTRQDHLVFKFPRTGGRTAGQMICPPSAVTRATDFMGRLADAGAELPLGIRPNDLVKELIERTAEEVGLFTSTPGWKQDRNGWSYLLPDRVVGTPAAPMILAHTNRCLAVGTAGRLDNWCKQVALPARHSIQASTAILAALAAPLLNFVSSNESFTLNIFGNSSSGKTTANRAAASVWGDPERLASWNTTDRALEEIAAENCDLPLILDDAELSTKDSDKRMQKPHAASHIIASGRGKSYAKVVSSHDRLEQLTFRCIGLSSSPVSMESSNARTDGDRVRFIELAVPHGDQGGIWASAPTSDQSNAARSEALNKAALENHGIAGVAWIENLVAQQQTLRESIVKFSAKFLKRLGQTRSVEGRIAKKCALLYAAGRLAIDAEILPWKKAELLTVTVQAYWAILETAFGQRFDPMGAVTALATVVSDGKVFPKVSQKGLLNVKSAAKAAGYLNVDTSQLLLSMNVFKRALTGDLKGEPLPSAHFDEVLDLLKKRGILLSGHGTGPTRDVRIGTGKVKMIALKMDKLESLVKASSGTSATKSAPSTPRSPRSRT